MKKIFFVCLVLFILGAAFATVSNTTDNGDLYFNDESSVILWGNLFTKINKVVNETTKLHETQNELSEHQNETNANLLNLHETQNVLSENLLKLSEHQKEINTNLLKLHETQNVLSANLLKLSEHQKEINANLLKLSENQNEIRDKVLKLNKRFDEQYVEQYFNSISEWTTVMRRQDGSVNFKRKWAEYRNGFGRPNGEFFIGLEKLHTMTTLDVPQELLVILRNHQNQTGIAKYDLFKIGSESEKYALTELGNYSGNAGDSLRYHSGMKFSTFEQDNDLDVDGNCARYKASGWWFNHCSECNLFGEYGTPWIGFNWLKWSGTRYSLKFAEMKIRPRYSAK